MQSETAYSTLAVDLVRRSTVIDMLGLLTLNYAKLASWEAQPSCFAPPDLARLRGSGTTIFHPAVGFTDGDVYASSLRDINGWNEFVTAHSSEFLRIDCAADLERAKSSGRLGIVIGQQNSLHFRTVDDVGFFYNLGQRVSQLTYDDNAIGGGSTDPRDVGLTAYGAQIIDRMNALGMAVDISHCSDRTTLDALHASRKPVLVTHSNCRALVPGCARCKTDEAIRLLAAKGGVMGITMVRTFVEPSGPATIEDVLNHIDHVANLVGVEHVGIGSDVDLDGRDARIRPRKRFDLDGIDYSQKIFDLTDGLIRRKYSAENIGLILGGNFQRALAAIWLPESAPAST
ncbi:MAG: membrane dipeptidase [Bryobacteraceae bacterium]